MRVRGQALCAGLKSKRPSNKKAQMCIYIPGGPCQAKPVCFENSPGELEPEEQGVCRPPARSEDALPRGRLRPEPRRFLQGQRPACSARVLRGRGAGEPGRRAAGSQSSHSPHPACNLEQNLFFLVALRMQR